YDTRANTEPCFLAIKGNMPVKAHDVLSLIYSPVREHSRKPDEQYRKIERLYPGARKLELFARRPRGGWSVWGNEVVSDVELATAI
ncbi:MAG: adenine methyltransferase, partial [Chloroflexi bacterium]|nr:adenine methyltransferase [Chloroflexota bacterium]